MSTTPPNRPAVTPTVNDTTIVDVDDRDDRMSWGAVFAGFVVALALQALFSLLGAGLGAGAIDPTEPGATFGGLGWGTGLYWLITSVISLFAGGWVAGRVAGTLFLPSAVVHGVCVWALATLAALYLTASAAGSAARLAGNAAQATASAAGDVAQASGEAVSNLAGQIGDPLSREVSQALEQRDMTMSDIRAELQAMSQEILAPRERRRVTEIAGDTAGRILRTPGDFSSDISLGLDRMFGGDGPLGEEDREELITALSDRFDLSEREAERIADRWQTRWNEAEERVESALETAQTEIAQGAEATAEAASGIAYSMALASFLGLLAAAVGGGIGRIDPEDDAVRRRRTVR
jgi:hypothetical protein